MPIEDAQGKKWHMTVVRIDRSIHRWMNGTPGNRCCICAREGNLIRGKKKENAEGLFCQVHARDAETSTVEVYK